MTARGFASALLLFLLVGCASGAKSPDAANSFEVLFGNNIELYLDDRRAQLGRLQGRVSTLDSEVLLELGQIHDLEKRLAAKENSTARSQEEVDALLEELATEKESAKEKFRKAVRLSEELEKLNADLGEAVRNRGQDRERITQIEGEIKQLEEEIVSLNRAIDRNLSLKAEQLLRDGPES